VESLDEFFFVVFDARLLQRELSSRGDRFSQEVGNKIALT